MRKKELVPKVFLKIGDNVKILTGQNKGLKGKIIGLNKKKALARLDCIKNRERYYTKIEKQQNYKKDEKNQNSLKKNLFSFIHISNLKLQKI